MEQPYFERIAQAINCTLEYYSIERIKLHMFRYAGTEHGYTTPHMADSWFETTKIVQNRINDEIRQIIYTSTPATIVEVFENLKEWLLDYRIVSVNKKLILDTIDKYNEDTYSRYKKEIEKREQDFRNTKEYLSLNHNEEYEENYPANFLFGGYYAAHTKKIKYHKFFCLESGPELIDISFIEQYYTVVAEIINHFKVVVRKHINRYEAGKVIPFTSLDEYKKLRIPKNPKGKPTPNKLKLDLSVKELAYLIKLLGDSKPDIFVLKNKAAILRFFATHFSTKKINKVDLNFDTLNTNFKTPEKETANKWVKRLEKMLGQARKV